MQSWKSVSYLATHICNVSSLAPPLSKSWIRPWGNHIGFILHATFPHAAAVECEDPGVCSQFCSQQSGVDTCSCGFGFFLASDNAACTGEQKFDNSRSPSSFRASSSLGGLVGEVQICDQRKKLEVDITPWKDFFLHGGRGALPESL
jgi:hypothetical protein